MKKITVVGNARLKLRAIGIEAEVFATIELSDPPYIRGTITGTSESDSVLSEWFDNNTKIDEIIVYAGTQGIYQFFKCILLKRKSVSEDENSFHEFEFLGDQRWNHLGTWKKGL